jgi:chloramphenicol O-acetyltransferase
MSIISERNAIEGKFGQGKNGYGLAKIRARLQDTSESWIMAIYLVMNLKKLVKNQSSLFFASIIYVICRLKKLIQPNYLRVKPAYGSYL